MMSVTQRVLNLIGITFAFVCVAAWAANSAMAGSADVDIGGRWKGSKSELARSKACDSDEAKCNELTLDVSSCGDSWCGVEVGSDGACGGIALRIKLDDTREGDGSDRYYKGALSLAKATEPYVVEVAYLMTSGDREPKAPHLSITGDTGGEFRFFRRTFPFHSYLSKVGPVTCTPEKALSMLE